MGLGRVCWGRTDVCVCGGKRPGAVPSGICHGRRSELGGEGGKGQEERGMVAEGWDGGPERWGGAGRGGD